MCECYDTLAKCLKVKKGFVIKGFEAPLCESSLSLCFAKRVMYQHCVEGHGYCIIHVYVCVQTFLGLDLSQRVRP